MTTNDSVKVWDLPLRVFHWSLAVAFAVAYVSGDEVLDLHVLAGYVVMGLLAFRTLWGFAGPRHARFSDFVHPPRAVAAYLWQALTFRAPRHLGHNPAGGAMVVALLVSLALTASSGLALYGAGEFAGPLAGLMARVGDGGAEYLEEAHEFCAGLTLGLVFAHLAGVLLSSLQHGENLLRAMVTGRKPATTAR
jgi:cytochrome b